MQDTEPAQAPPPVVTKYKKPKKGKKQGKGKQPGKGKQGRAHAASAPRATPALAAALNHAPTAVSDEVPAPDMPQRAECGDGIAALAADDLQPGQEGAADAPPADDGQDDSSPPPAAPPASDSELPPLSACGDSGAPRDDTSNTSQPEPDVPASGAARPSGAGSNGSKTEEDELEALRRKMARLEAVKREMSAPDGAVHAFADAAAGELRHICYNMNAGEVVLEEATEVRIRIVTHTQSFGDSNLFCK